MKKIIMLSMANIRKARGQAVSLLIFIFIAAMLLSLGLLLFINFGEFFDKKVDQLGAPHFVVLEERRVYDESQTSFLRDYKGVEKVERDDVLSFMTDIEYNDGEMPAILVLSNASSAKGMSKVTLSEGKNELSKNGIYLPSIFKLGGGYKIGDEYYIEIGGEYRKYLIEGFTEEITFGSLNNQLYRIYFSEDEFNEINKEHPELDCVLQSVRMDDFEQTPFLSADYTTEFFYNKTVPDTSTKYVFSLEYNGVKEARTFLANIIAIIMVAFAGMIVVISLIVIRFRIKNSIEENMTNIGALKAIGYTGKQIISSYVIQFGGISIIGAFLGIVGSYAVLPAISFMMEAQTALVWEQGLDIFLSIVTFSVIMISIVLVTVISARGITKKTPLKALKSELNLKHYNKNYLPLSKTKGSLTFILAVKSIMQSKGQSITIAIIIALASFIAVSGIAMYTNVGMNSKEFTQTIAGELPDAAFGVKNSEDAPRLMEKFKKEKEVRSAFYSEGVTLLVDDFEAMSTVTEDFSDYEGSYLFDGNYPKKADEIAISSLLGSSMEKGIGDVVTITQGDKKSEYKITGMLQTMNDGGKLVALTDLGVKQVIPDYKPMFIYLYLNNPENTSQFVKDVKKEEGEIFRTVIDMQELSETQLGAYNSIFFILAVVILGITLFIIFLVLSLVLKTMILNKSRALGIQKAIGFSTWNLVNQMAMNLFPMIVVGVIVGCFAGFVGFNPLMGSLFKTMGIMNTPMDVSLSVTLVISIALIIISWLLSMLISARVKRISPIILMGE